MNLIGHLVDTQYSTSFICQDVGVGLIAVLDQLKIPQVVVLGDGAGAYIALRLVIFNLCTTCPKNIGRSEKKV